MDGSNLTTLLTRKIGQPNGLTIDFSARKLFWADARLDTIEYADIDGSNRRIVPGLRVPHPFAITIFEDQIFWTDWLTKGVHKCHKWSGKNHVIMKNTTHKPMDIQVKDYVIYCVTCFTHASWVKHFSSQIHLAIRLFLYIAWLLKEYFFFYCGHDTVSQVSVYSGYEGSCQGMLYHHIYYSVYPSQEGDHYITSNYLKHITNQHFKVLISLVGSVRIEKELKKFLDDSYNTFWLTFIFSEM